MSSVGVPVKVLQEALGHIVTVETKRGELFRGKLTDAEDYLNVMLRDVVQTGRDGKVTQLDQIYIRGSRVTMFIIPDILKNVPMFKTIGVNAMKNRGVGAAKGRAILQTRGRGAAALPRGRGNTGRGVAPPIRR